MERMGLCTPQPFNIDAADLYCEWQHWVSSFDIYSVASELSDKDDKVQRATFLHCLGPAVQRIFRTLPGEHKKLEDAKLALQNYFAPKRNVVSERYKFRSREQRPDEPIDSYLTALRELAKSCEFGTLEEEMIRDQIVEKCASKSLRQKLLTQDDLDLTKTMKVARSEESSRKDASMITKGTKEDPIPVDKVNAKKPTDGADEKRFICYRCGGLDGHSPNECGAINSRCNSCKKVGHLARVCKSSKQDQKANRKQGKKSRKNPKKTDRKVRNLKAAEWFSEESTDENEPVFSMNNEDSSVQVKMDGQKIRMIVDTGCKYNIISSQLYNAKFKSHELRPSKKRFIAYGQKDPLNCKGYFTATIKVGKKEIRANVYVIQGHSESLLGRDSSFNLEIISVNLVQDKPSFPKTSENSELDSLLREFDEIFHGIGKVANFEHKIAIDSSVKPVSQRLRRIPFSQIEAVNNELDKMLENDIIEEVTEASPWVSNLVIVPKKSGEIRVCCDLREVNKAVIRERHLLPKVDDTLQAMHSSKYFAKIDAKSGFFQLTLAEESWYITTFISPCGCFRFKRTPFGLSDSSEAFQKMMEQILFRIDRVQISIDDVIVHAVTMEELINRLRKVFERCRANNLRLNQSKCEFGVTKISVLGHVVSADGIKPDPKKCEAIKATPPPKNVSDLRSFLGTCGYVSKFIPNYANIVEPLRKLTRSEVKFSWGKEQKEAFEALKEALSCEPVLACFRLNSPTYLITDASPVGLGAILLQHQTNSKRKPIAYIS